MRLQRRWQLALALLVVSLVGVLWIFWGVLRAGPMHAAPEMQYDTTQFIWTNAWIAHALTHFQNPFFSSNLMHPYGFNLLANVYNIAFSVVFAPVTWLFSPVLSVNLQLMMNPVADVLAMGLCLRRMVRSPWLAVAGGTAWGFSPFVVTSVAKGWTNVGFLVAPPLVAWLLLELANERGWSPRRIGLALASVVAVQYFVDSELLAITLIGAAVGLTVVAIQERHRIQTVVHRWLRALAWGAGPVALILTGPILYGVWGPHSMPAWVRPESAFRQFVSPPRGVLFTPRNPTLPPNLHFSVTANPQFLGFGAFVVVILGLLLFRFPRPLRSVAVVGLFGFWVSVGYGPWWSPFDVIARIPILHNVTETRFIILTWFAVIVIVVDIAGRAWTWCSERITWPAAAIVISCAVVLAAFTPPLEAVAQTLPVSASSTTGDNALAVVLAQPGSHVVLGYPFPVSVREMLQQARENDFSFEMPGGEWPQIFDSPEPGTTVSEQMLLAGQGKQLAAPTLEQVRALQSWLVTWGVTDVIVPRSYIPAYAAVYASPQQFVAIVTEALGAPRLIEGEWVWERVTVTTATAVVGQSGWSRCTSPDFTVVTRTPACIERHLSALTRATIPLR